MDMLEEMERQRARPVEQIDIMLLRIHQIRLRKLVAELANPSAFRGREQCFGIERLRKLARGLLQPLIGVAEQRAENLEGSRHGFTPPPLPAPCACVLH